MATIKLNLKNRSYNIIVGCNIINLLGKYIKEQNIGSSAYVITNALIKAKYGNSLKKILLSAGLSLRFKIVPDSEKSKSLNTLMNVLNDIARFDKKKKIFVIAFGGGVIGDLAGFTASIYKRGVPYIQVPTTLLAQVDSAIGGKTGIDLLAGKNLVGEFYQPRLVYSDVKFLKTLSLRQIKSGLAEVIKYAAIKDKDLFLYLEKNFRDILGLKTNTLEHIVNRCSFIKAKIVGLDEREEKGIRTILNFGHTAGHAIEAASGYKLYNHGEAIAIGMLVAADISVALKLASQTTASRIEKLIKNVGLPCRIKNISLEKIIAKHYHDKKFIGAKNRFVLISGLGRTKIVENIPMAIIKQVLRKRLF